MILYQIERIEKFGTIPLVCLCFFFDLSMSTLAVQVKMLSCNRKQNRRVEGGGKKITMSGKW